MVTCHNSSNYATIEVPLQLSPGSKHDHLFCYCPLVGILFEVLRIVSDTGSDDCIQPTCIRRFQDNSSYKLAESLRSLYVLCYEPFHLEDNCVQYPCNALYTLNLVYIMFLLDVLPQFADQSVLQLLTKLTGPNST